MRNERIGGEEPSQLRIVDAPVHVNEAGAVQVLVPGKAPAGADIQAFQQGGEFRRTDRPDPVTVAAFAEGVIGQHLQLTVADLLLLSFPLTDSDLYLT